MKDSGYAFPNTWVDRTIPGVSETVIFNGMLLRDYFAAAALTGYCQTSYPMTCEEVAIRCYGCADAMMKAREVKTS